MVHVVSSFRVPLLAMDKSVLEVFHKFDSDGSGAISRDELGEAGEG